jgi:hypothetical protein
MLSLGEVDKVQVVKRNASVSHYRAYFARTQLKPIYGHKKYLFFYNKKKKDLAILLYKYHTYTLYSLYHPQQKIKMSASGNGRYSKVRRMLRKKGYRLTSPKKVAAVVDVALRRFKGHKTLRVEVKNYQALQKRAIRAIRTYDASILTSNKTALPKSLISHLYNVYKNQASTPQERTAIEVISTNLHLNSAKIKQNLNVEETLSKEVPEKITQSEITFNHYIKVASLAELSTFMEEENTQNALSYTQYRKLKYRLKILKEEKLLSEGSLEELISAYKINHNPRFKERILTLVKEVQK